MNTPPTAAVHTVPALAALTPEQWRIYLEVDAQKAVQWTDREDDLIRELARHLPGLAPAILVIGAHLIEQNVADYGVCREGQTV